MYTCEDYIAGKILKLNDEVQFNDTLKGVARQGSGDRYYISINGHDNSAPFDALGIDKHDRYILCKNWSKDSDEDGIFPYHRSIKGLTETVANLWVRFGILDASKLRKLSPPKKKMDSDHGIVLKDTFSIGCFTYSCTVRYGSGYFFRIEQAPSAEYRSNDGIFRYLGIDKNLFFEQYCKDYGGSEDITDSDSKACPYAKTLEGFNNVVDNLRKIYALSEYKKERTVKKEELVAEMPLPWDDDSVYKDIEWHNSHKEIKIPVSKPITSFKIIL